MGSGVVKKKR